jgi:hypothetical protein
MANRDAPSGLRPAYHHRGGVVRPGGEYTLATGLASNIFSGDLVKSTGTGRNIDVVAAGDRSVGVFYGVEFVDSEGNQRFERKWVSGTAGTDIKVYVYDDPSIVFEIQADGSLVEANIGSVADVVVGTGTASTGRSQMELAISTLAATGSAQLKVLGLVPVPDNAYGVNAKVYVLINEHELGAAHTAV